MEPVEEVVRARPQALAATELDGRDRHVDGVDEVRLQELPDRGDAAPEAHVLALGGLGGSLQRLRG